MSERLTASAFALVRASALDLRETVEEYRRGTETHGFDEEEQLAAEVEASIRQWRAARKAYLAAYDR